MSQAQFGWSFLCFIHVVSIHSSREIIPFSVTATIVFTMGIGLVGLLSTRSESTSQETLVVYSFTYISSISRRVLFWVLNSSTFGRQSKWNEEHTFQSRLVTSKRLWYSLSMEIPLSEWPSRGSLNLKIEMHTVHSFPDWLICYMLEISGPYVADGVIDTWFINPSVIH